MIKSYIGCLLLLPCLLTAQHSDVLIVHDPAALIMYDNYRRPLNRAVQAALPSDLPWRVELAAEPSSDGLSRVMRVRDFKNRLFTIALDENDTPLWRYPTDWYLLKKTRLRNDTLIVTADHKITIGRADRLPHKSFSASQTLPANSRLYLYFDYGRYVYAYRPGEKAFVWLKRSALKWTQPAPSHQPEATRRAAPQKEQTGWAERLTERLQRINSTYSALNNFVARQTKQPPQPAPRWVALADGGGWRIQPENPEVSARFPQSGAYYLKQLARWAESYGFEVERQENSLYIRRAHD
ncbi:MAG: hypothetical protein D6677_14060 [Calditrichaeota bacterium]|nr:MAG: hypothetical protein D6677_14060 [Calditrichota bacterium]